MEFETSSIDGPYLSGSGGGTIARLGSISYYMTGDYDMAWADGADVDISDVHITFDDLGSNAYMGGSMLGSWEMFLIRSADSTVLTTAWIAATKR